MQFYLSLISIFIFLILTRFQHSISLRELVFSVIFISLFLYSFAHIATLIFRFFVKHSCTRSAIERVKYLSILFDKYLNKISTSLFFKSNLAAVLFLETISVVIYHNWFSFSVFVSGDHHYISSEALAYFKSPSVWTALTGLGEPNWSLWSAYPSSLFGFFGSLGFDSSVVINIFVLWFIALIAPIISFFFVKRFTKNNFTAFIFSLLLLFNAYLLTNIVVGHLFLSVAFYIALSAFIFYDIFIESRLKNNSALILSALLLWLTGTVDFRIFYLLLLSFVLYQFLYFLLHKVKIQKRLLFGKNISFLLLILFLNFNWILPTIIIDENNSVLSRAIFGKGLTDLFNSWSGTYYYWSLSNKIVWGVDTGFPIVFLLLPLAVIIALYYSKKNATIVVFSILFLIGTFFGKQNTTPFARIYEFLFAYFPGFSAFRDATKFFQITYWSLPIVLALGYENTKNIIAKNIILLITLVIVGLNIFSLLIYQNHLFEPVVVPDYYRDLYKLKNGKFNRVLWVPGTEVFRAASTLNPRINFWDTKNTDWLNILKDDDMPFISKNAVINDNFRPLITMSSVGYILVPPQLQTEDMNINDDAFYYDEYRDEIIENLNSLDWLTERQIESKDASVYVNKNRRPHFYMTNQLETFNNFLDLKISEVQYKSTNPSIYQLYLKNITSNDYFLTFTDSYSEQWQIGPKLDSILNLVTWKNTIFPKGSRIKNDAGLNVFVINKMFIESVANDYVTNADGSIDATVTLYYGPQRLLVLGNIITGLSLLVVLGYFVRTLIVKNQ